MQIMVCLCCRKTVGKDSGCRKKIISEFEFPWLFRNWEMAGILYQKMVKFHLFPGVFQLKDDDKKALFMVNELDGAP